MPISYYRNEYDFSEFLIFPTGILFTQDRYSHMTRPIIASTRNMVTATALFLVTISPALSAELSSAAAQPTNSQSSERGSRQGGQGTGRTSDQNKPSRQGNRSSGDSGQAGNQQSDGQAGTTGRGGSRGQSGQGPGGNDRNKSDFENVLDIFGAITKLGGSAQGGNRGGDGAQRGEDQRGVGDRTRSGDERRGGRERHGADRSRSRDERHGGSQRGGGEDRGRPEGFQRGGPSDAGQERHGYQVGGKEYPRIRAERYRYPQNFGYQRYSRGDTLPRDLIRETYFIYDFVRYSLWEPQYGAEWIRIGPDALLIDPRTGQVFDVVPDVFDDGSEPAGDWRDRSGPQEASPAFPAGASPGADDWSNEPTEPWRRLEWLEARVRYDEAQGTLTASGVAEAIAGLNSIRDEADRIQGRDGGEMSDVNMNYIADRIEYMSKRLRWMEQVHR